MEFLIPDITGDLVIGGVMWGVFVSALISAFTHFVAPLTEKQIQLSKGALMVLGYILALVITNNPELNDAVTAVVSVVTMFLISTGFYEHAKGVAPSFRSVRSDRYTNIVSVPNSTNLRFLTSKVDDEFNKIPLKHELDVGPPTVDFEGNVNE